MASVRGLLNIQSLNELTYEKCVCVISNTRQLTRVWNVNMWFI
jgi:hypothetical protein